MGGIIGYITNDIAIRMLFRPHKAKYVFGMKLPFTPGVIPKEKGRIAKAIGGTISEYLISKDVLEKNLLSDEMLAKIHSSLDTFFDEQKKNKETVREFLLHYLSEEEIDNLVANVNESLQTQISEKLANAELGDKIADVVIDHVSEKLKIEGLDINIPQILRSMFGQTIWGKVAELIAQPAKHFFAQNVNQLIKDKGTEIVGNLINEQIADLANMQVQSLLKDNDEQINQLKDGCISFYTSIIRDYLPNILKTIDIPSMIETRINEMDMMETERLIFLVMDKELKAIVWFGALLGIAMGSINFLV